MQRKAKLRGVFAPLVTPFHKDETIAYEGLKHNIACYNRTALCGYMPLGSNGEFLGLTDEEALEILHTVRDHAAEEKVIVAGCGRESAYKTIAFIRRAAVYGLDYAFILPPHYYVPFMTEEAIRAYYLRIADASPIPLVIYQAPKFAAGISLSPSFVYALSRHANIIAIKNSSNVRNSEYVQLLDKDGDFCVIAGNIQSFLPGLIDGASGGVLSTASCLPEICCRLFDLFCAGKMEEATALHESIKTLSEEAIAPYGVAGVKSAMELRGLHGGNLRTPLQALAKGARDEMKEKFAVYGIEKFI